MAGDIGQRRNVRHSREFPGIAALHLGNRAQALGAGKLPIMPRPLTGADGGYGVFADAGGHAAPVDRHAPFAHSHEPRLAWKSSNDALYPIIVPAPVPDHQGLPGARAPNALVEGSVKLCDHLGWRAFAAARARLAVAVRPAVRKVLGAGDGEKTAQLDRKSTRLN